MAISSLQNLTLKLTKKDLAVTTLALSLFFFSFFFFNLSPKLTPIPPSPTFSLHPGDFVELTLLRTAEHIGAFCLDGSLPAYHFRKGFGSGSNNWVLHIEGGGWCDSIASCSFRKSTALGSSYHMERQVRFSGVLSHDPANNPDFFNWNKVKIRYCDGASFAGHPTNEFNNGTNLFFRGQLIWEAVMNELLEIGMTNAEQALLSGCSAGGLATMIHCDDFRAKLPKATAVKCLADASFFLDEKDVGGSRTMRLFYRNVVKLHGVAETMPKDCVANMDPAMCFFPQQIIKSIKTPIFLVNPAYDFWQIQNVLVPANSNLQRDWRTCRLSIQKCSPNQIDILQGSDSKCGQILSSETVHWKQHDSHNLLLVILSPILLRLGWKYRMRQGVEHRTLFCEKISGWEMKRWSAVSYQKVRVSDMRHTTKLKCRSNKSSFNNTLAPKIMHDFFSVSDEFLLYVSSALQKICW